MTSKDNYYEIYHNAQYNRPFYFHKASGQSVWELPKGAVAVDMREQTTEP